MKTLAVRLEDEQHARLTILSKLAEMNVTDTIRGAIEDRLTKMSNDPQISAKAEALAAEIDREAAEQRAAIAGLFSDGTKSSTRTSSTKTTRSGA